MIFNAFIALALSLITIAAGGLLKYRAADSAAECRRFARFTGIFVSIGGVVIFVLTIYFALTYQPQQHGMKMKDMMGKPRYELDIQPGSMMNSPGVPPRSLTNNLHQDMPQNQPPPITEPITPPADQPDDKPGVIPGPGTPPGGGPIPGDITPDPDSGTNPDVTTEGTQ